MFSTIILKPAKDTRVTACKGCGQKIVWRETMGGKKIPLDFDHHTTETVLGYEEVDSRFVHFSTCPQADTFRRPRA